MTESTHDAARPLESGPAVESATEPAPEPATNPAAVTTSAPRAERSAELPAEPDPLATVRRPSRRTELARAIGAAVLWAGAAVLSLLAAYATLYEISLRAGTTANHYSVDAAGTYRGAGAGSFPQSGAHYSVILYVCAAVCGLLVLGTVGTAAGLPAGPRLRLAITGGSFAVAGALAATLAAIYLQTDSILGNVRNQVSFGASVGTIAPTAVATHYGPGPFLALGALACAVLALAAALWGRAEAVDTVSTVDATEQG